MPRATKLCIFDTLHNNYTESYEGNGTAIVSADQQVTSQCHLQFGANLDSWALSGSSGMLTVGMTFSADQALKCPCQCGGNANDVNLITNLVSKCIFCLFKTYSAAEAAIVQESLHVPLESTG